MRWQLSLTCTEPFLPHTTATDTYPHTACCCPHTRTHGTRCTPQRTDYQPLRDQLRGPQSAQLSSQQKLELWQALASHSFCRALGSVWLVPLLDLLVRLKLHVVGRWVTDCQVFCGEQVRSLLYGERMVVTYKRGYSCSPLVFSWRTTHAFVRHLPAKLLLDLYSICCVPRCCCDLLPPPT
jgi:hypothetical protein